MSISIGIDGSYRNSNRLYAGVDGAWRQIISGYVGIDGIWHRVYCLLPDYVTLDQASISNYIGAGGTTICYNISI